jgi:hypothetical protein
VVACATREREHGGTKHGEARGTGPRGHVVGRTAVSVGRLDRWV